MLGSDAPVVTPYSRWLVAQCGDMKSAMPQQGFTLLELMVTITIGGILLAIAVPALGTFIRGSRLSGSARDFVVDLSLARNEAVLRATTVSVCTSTNLTSCTASGWASGRLVFVDGAAVGSVDAGDQILSVTQPLNSSLTTTASGVAATNVITYSALGRVSGVGQITICTAGQLQRDINIRASGSASLDRTATAC
jgi:type IV fimbrial biogenesis protein FimT